MGKIRKQFLQEKHGATLSPFIATFISTAESLPLYQLRSHINTFPRRWPFPRGDLYHWISLLNAFDGILDQFTSIYGLNHGPQEKDFGAELLRQDLSKQSGDSVSQEQLENILKDNGLAEQGDLDLVKDIVDFTRTLHENCGNRSLYASSDRLNDLLNTTSLDLLEKTLRLTHRLAQRYTASRLRTQGPSTQLGHISQSLLSAHYSIDLHKLEAMVWPLEWVVEDGQQASDRNEAANHSGLDVTRHDNTSHKKVFGRVSDMKVLGDDLPRNIVVDAASHLSTQLPADASQDVQYLTRHRIRTFKGMAESRQGRIDSVAIRLLAIANLAQIYPETTLQERALRFYNDKPRHHQLPQVLCELIHPPGRNSSKVPRKIQTLALLTLESLMNHKNKANEVCTALNVSVNHGPLASTLRQAVNHITSEGDDYSDEDSEWLGELFSLLHALVKSNGRAFEGLLSAGLIDMLIEILKSKTPKAERRHAPALAFLTVFLYSASDAFGAFVNAGGLDVVSELLVHEIKRATLLVQEGKFMPPKYKTQITDYQIPFVQQQCIRGIFKFVFSMLGMTGGPFDRLLRNLIEDSNVLAAMRDVIVHAKVFGSNIWTNCVCVFSTFINNEPTSFNAIAEAGIPKAILECIVQHSLSDVPTPEAPDENAELSNAALATRDGPAPDNSVATATTASIPVGSAGGILPACEAVNAIPDAFGAMCLNEAGMRLFESSGALETLFGVFTSPAHAKAFDSSPGSDVERLGGSIEQLHRHNPTLGTKINSLVIEAADRVARLVSTAPLSGLLPDEVSRPVDGAARFSLVEDVEMQEASNPGVQTRSPSAERSTTSVTVYVNVFSKFLAVLFRNSSFCDNFTDRGGLESLLTMACAPGLFRGFEPSKGSWSSLHKFADVLRHMADQKPFLVLPALISRLRFYLRKTTPLTEHTHESSCLLPLTGTGTVGKLEGPVRQEREEAVRSLVTIKLLVEGLSKSLVANVPTTPTRALPPSPLTVANVGDLLCPLIEELGRLQTKLLWEQQLYFEAKGSSILPIMSRFDSSAASRTEQTRISNTALPGQSASSNDGTPRVGEVIHDDGSQTNSDVVFIAINYQFSLPGSIVDLFGKISSTIVPRRLYMDPYYQRQQALKVTSQLAQVLVDRLLFKFPHDATHRSIAAFHKASLDCMRAPMLGSSHRDYPQRTGHIQTLVVLALKNKGGIELMGQHAKMLLQESIRPKLETEADISYEKRRDDAIQALNRYLAMLGALVEKKPVVDAPQTAALSTARDQGRESPDYFLPNQFLVELRVKAVRAISGIWTSDDLHRLQSSTIKLIAKLLSTVLEGVGDHGAFKRNDNISKPASAAHTKWKPRRDHLESLLGSGFSSALSQEALYRCFNNFSSAREYCSYFSEHRGSGNEGYPTSDREVELVSEEDLNHESPADLNPNAGNDLSQSGAEDILADLMDASARANESHPDVVDGILDVANTILPNPDDQPEVSPPTQEPRASKTAPKVEDVEGVITIEDLDDERATLRTSLMDRCLSLAGSFEDVIFEMGDLIIASIVQAPDRSEMRREISATLVMSLVSYAGNENLRAEAKKVSGIAHLLGVVLQNSEFFDAAREELEDSFSSIVSLIPIPPGSKPSEAAPWIPQILLLLEFILAEDVQPHQIEWEPPTGDKPLDEKPPIAQLKEAMISRQEKQEMFDQLMDLLPKVGKELELAIAIVRVLVVLTRDRHLATTLAEKRNMQRFLVLVKQIAPIMTDRLKSSVMIILRHVIEDDDTIRRLIRSEIKDLLERPPRPIDTTRYTRDLYHLVLRAPELFVEVTNEIVELARYDRSQGAQSPQILTLKKASEINGSGSKNLEAPATETSTIEMETERVDKAIPSMETADVSGKGKAPDLIAPVVENPDGVIHYLLYELLSYKDVEDKKPSDAKSESSQPQAQDVEMSTESSTSLSTTSAVTAPTKHRDDPQPFNPEDHPIYVYRCFLLQALTELLGSYNKTKVEMINFSRKADPQAATPSKPRSGVLNYLLNGLLPTGSIEHPNDIDSKKKAAVSGCAVGTIVALCARTSENGAVKQRDAAEAEEEPDLSFVRRFVLEHALKAFKDSLASSDPAPARYSKLLALADLFNRMLAGRPSPPQPGYRQSNPQEDNLVPTNKQIAKIMFEKNFISTLTSSLSDADLNLVGANRVVKYILRPLKLLTHTAIELSLSSDLSSSPSNTVDEEDIISATSVSDDGHEREETPDLFRNSTLGMFDPSRVEDEDSSEEEESDDGDDDPYGESYADDMEFEEGEPDDTADGDVVSDEDMEGNGTGDEMMEGLDGDVGIDVEIDMEESGSDDDHEGGSDEDAEMEEYGSDSSEDDSDPDEDGSEVEIVDEITGDDENESLGEPHEDTGEWQEDEDESGGQAILNLLGHAGTFAADESHSETGLEPFSGVAMDAETVHEHLDLDLDGPDGEDDNDTGGEDDEDEEDYDDEVMYHEAEDDDSEMPPYIFNQWPSTPGRRIHVGRPGFSRIEDFDFSGDPMNLFNTGSHTSHRLQASRNNELTDGTNPLLDRLRRPQIGNTGSAQHTSHHHAHTLSHITNLIPRLEDLGSGSDPEHYHYLTSLINALGRGGPAGLLPALHGRHHHHGAIQFRLGGPSGSGPGEFMEIQIRPQTGSQFPFAPAQQGPSRTSHSVMAESHPALTAERWQEEARLIFGSTYPEKALRVVNSILRLLVPPAIEAEAARKKKAAEDIKRRQEELMRLEAESKERAEQEKKEREEREERERAEAEAAASERRANEQTEIDETDANSMEGVEGVTDQSATTTTTATDERPSATSERVHTNIRGQRLDITDLGIDSDYLEALPEEMREEVIMQQFADHRSQAAAAGNEPTTYDNEFLEALPPDIREEILQQERQDRRRREREEQRRRAAASAGQQPQAEEMDPASFMASLDPTLRQQVLAEADDDMLASLPPDLAAEARALGGHHRRRAIDPTRLMADIDHMTGLGSGRGRQEGTGDGRSTRRPIVQMLDKSGIVTLLRLMFIPVQGNAQQTLNAILRNVSGNHQTRSEIVSGLLMVLQEGSVDQAAVERSFHNITNRAKQLPSNKTPVKKTASSDVSLHSDASPRLVIGNCLASLIFLTQSIAHIPKFFLTEHEVGNSSKKTPKGKGKAKDTRASRIPLNALLSLLGRDVVIDNSQLIEQLAGLLQNVTQPLPALLKKDKEAATESAAATNGKERDDSRPNVGATASASAASASVVSTSLNDNGDVPQTLELDNAIPPVEVSAAGVATTETNPPSAEAKKPFIAPEIPEENLRLIINILTARDCGGKTFRDTLSTINNLSSIPDARQAFGKELAARARDLGRLIASDLAQLMKDFRGAGDEMEAQNMALAKFSPTESNQSKLNRVLTALDYLFDAKVVEGKDSANKLSNGLLESGNDLLTSLHEDPTFTRVWNELSGTLSAAHEVLAKGQQSDKTYLNVATILLPLIESLMVVCKRLDLKDARSTNVSQKASAPSTPSPEPTMKMIFFNFTNKHRKILNDLVRSNPKLMSGSFSVLVKNSSVLEFDNKRNYFNRRLHHRTMDMRHYPHPTLQLSVRRNLVFTDSYRSLYFKKPEEMKYGKLNIRFHNEEGVDAGGVTREWFQVLSRQMFDPSYALFNPVASDRTTFHPNPQSAINDSHLNYFHFIGRIIGKALYENRVLDCHFSRAVYKRILGKAVSLKDMETIDLDYSKSLQWMLDNDITDIITESFSVTSDYFGVTEVIDLIENGRNIAVTEENKHEYVRLVIDYKLTGSVKDQLESFLHGFHDIVPAELIAIFDEGELELLISGMPEIDIFDWKNNTDYQNYNANSPQIQWFWRALRSFDKEERAKFLQFVTGTGKVPLNGFKELEGMNGVTRFSIHKDYGSKDRLPSSHTCFNQLDLPEYDSYESLRKNLYTAMTTGGEYFGFA